MGYERESYCFFGSLNVVLVVDNMTRNGTSPGKEVGLTSILLSVTSVDILVQMFSIPRSILDL
jgi:hypothetical protein